MNRLYNSLEKEMSKTKPSPKVLNMYLNQEFSSRRATIKSMALDERYAKVFEIYPCFMSHVEVPYLLDVLVNKYFHLKNEKASSFLKNCNFLDY